MSRNSLVRVHITPLSWRYILHNPNRARLLKRILNLADAVGRLARWHLHLFKVEFDVNYCLGIKHQAADTLSCLKATIADTESIKNDLPVAVIVTDTKESTKVPLENHQQALAELVKDSDSLRKGAAHTIADLLQHQATDRFYRQPAQNVGTRKAEHTIDKDKLIVRVVPIDGQLRSLYRNHFENASYITYTTL